MHGRRSSRSMRIVHSSTSSSEDIVSATQDGRASRVVRVIPIGSTSRRLVRVVQDPPPDTSSQNVRIVQRKGSSSQVHLYESSDISSGEQSELAGLRVYRRKSESSPKIRVSNEVQSSEEDKRVYIIKGDESSARVQVRLAGEEERLVGQSVIMQDSSSPVRVKLVKDDGPQTIHVYQKDPPPPPRLRIIKEPPEPPQTLYVHQKEPSEPAQLRLIKEPADPPQTFHVHQKEPSEPAQLHLIKEPADAPQTFHVHQKEPSPPAQLHIIKEQPDPPQTFHIHQKEPTRPPQLHLIREPPGPAQTFHIRQKEPAPPPEVHVIKQQCTPPMPLHIIQKEPPPPPQIHIIKQPAPPPQTFHVIQKEPAPPPQLHIVKQATQAPPPVHVVQKEPAPPAQLHLVKEPPPPPQTFHVRQKEPAPPAQLHLIKEPAGPPQTFHVRQQEPAPPPELHLIKEPAEPAKTFHVHQQEPTPPPELHVIKDAAPPPQTVHVHQKEPTPPPNIQIIKDPAPPPKTIHLHDQGSGTQLRVVKDAGPQAVHVHEDDSASQVRVVKARRSSARRASGLQGEQAMQLRVLRSGAKSELVCLRQSQSSSSLRLKIQERTKRTVQVLGAESRNTFGGSWTGRNVAFAWQPVRPVSKMAGPICCRATLAFLLIALLPVSNARNHRLSLKGEQRRYFSVTTFGFLVGGELNVEVEALSFSPSTNRVGFSLTRTPTDSVNPYPDGRIEGCPLDEVKEDMYVLTLALDTSENRGLVLRCNRNFSDLDVRLQPNWRPQPRMVRQTSAVQPVLRARRDTNAVTTTTAVPTTPKPVATPSATIVGCHAGTSSPVHRDAVDGVTVYSFQFGVSIKEAHEGLYSLYFHNCLVNPLGFLNNSANLSVSISERNEGSFLSAGEIPLPQVYFLMAVVFFAAGCYWIYLLRQRRHVLSGVKLHRVQSHDGRRWPKQGQRCSCLRHKPLSHIQSSAISSRVSECKLCL
ncbi:hypothetical protein V5799_005346 [Amblyomma americanum]|uniref:Uncharacterized protein n=1 Tax=Amblyomma americanum TaxID=6943 RepID=A0AAQ4DZI3_AMBAM